MADGERELVRWLQARGGAHPEVLLGIGDDMAALDLGPGPLLLTCDMLLDGVHFDSRALSLAAIGRKAANCSLSDCAAMAVRPVAAVIALALPRNFGAARAKELLAAFAEACEVFGCRLVGGDTTSWKNPLALDVTMLAKPYPSLAPVRRSGARPGDTLFVTGPLGGSLRDKHLTFTPRVLEASRLAESLGPRLHAMLDITDGLAIDTDRLREASGVGAVLDEGLVRAAASDDAKAASAETGRDVLDHVLGDGEDFELLFAAQATEEEGRGLGCLPVGEITTEGGLQLRRADGTIVPLAASGYQHL
jgi:thiamine-monophosphate kinase